LSARDVPTGTTLRLLTNEKPGALVAGAVVTMAGAALIILKARNSLPMRD
jgi:hypothetical protein